LHFRCVRSFDWVDYITGVLALPAGLLYSIFHPHDNLPF
jgi:hypothetical protein